MRDTPGRMLTLLALFQQRPTWGGAELAERLGVTDRTVRRDVERLRDLGYPVDAAPGVSGGYRLGRGGSLPPLLLGDDEAVAVALGLRMAVDGGVTGLEDAVVSVLGRLGQLLPPHLAARVRALHSVTERVEDRWQAAVASEQIVGLAQACGRSERVRFAYADRSGRDSARLVEPYRLVRVGPRWYLVARDLDRADWRTFRVDRLSGLEQLGTPFTLVDPPDAVDMVRRGIRVRVWPYEARIRVSVPAEEAARLLPGHIGLEDEGANTVATVGSTSAERMVRYLLGLPGGCEVLAPADLRAELAARARRLAEANGDARTGSSVAG